MGAFFPEKVHGARQVTIDIVDIPLCSCQVLVSENPLNRLCADLVGVCQQ